jgi:hypothetical protein
VEPVEDVSVVLGRLVPGSVNEGDGRMGTHPPSPFLKLYAIDGSSSTYSPFSFSTAGAGDRFPYWARKQNQHPTITRPHRTIPLSAPPRIGPMR